MVFDYCPDRGTVGKDFFYSRGSKGVRVQSAEKSLPVFTDALQGGRHNKEARTGIKKKTTGLFPLSLDPGDDLLNNRELVFRTDPYQRLALVNAVAGGEIHRVNDSGFSGIVDRGVPLHQRHGDNLVSGLNKNRPGSFLLNPGLDIHRKIIPSPLRGLEQEQNLLKDALNDFFFLERMTDSEQLFSGFDKMTVQLGADKGNCSVGLEVITLVLRSR